jgi:hypothetical protein
MTLYDWLQLYVLFNAFVVVFYSTYAIPSSPIYQDKLKAIFSVVITASFGSILVLIHAFKGGKGE